MMSKSLGAWLTAALLALSAPGCGGDPESTPCDQMGAKVCQGACGCSAECKFGSHGISLGFKSESSCEVAVVNACGRSPTKSSSRNAVAVASSSSRRWLGQRSMAATIPACIR